MGMRKTASNGGFLFYVVFMKKLVVFKGYG